MDHVQFKVTPITDEESGVTVVCGDASVYFRSKWRPTIVELKDLVRLFVSEYKRLTGGATEEFKSVKVTDDHFEILDDIAEGPITLESLHEDEKDVVAQLIDYNLAVEVYIEEVWCLAITREGYDVYVSEKGVPMNEEAT